MTAPLNGVKIGGERGSCVREDPGACLEEIMVLGLGGQIMARYSEWRVLEGEIAHFGGLGQEGVLEGAGRTR